MTTARRPQMEFWFEFGSNYSYLSTMRIGSLAANHDVEVIWKPFLLGPIFKALGWETSPFVLQKEKGAYVWKDMARQCRKYGIPWRKPTRFPRPAILPARVALVGASEPWGPEFAQQIMLLNFAADQDIDDAETVASALEQVGVEAGPVIEHALSEANKGRLRSQTDEARSRGVFGAPTFFVRGEMFWGNDRLEEALEFASLASLV